MCRNQNVTLTSFKCNWSKYTNNETTKITSINSSRTYTGIYHNVIYYFFKKNNENVLKLHLDTIFLTLK